MFLYKRPSDFWCSFSFKSVYVESVGVQDIKLRHYLTRWWLVGLSTCCQSPMTLTSGDRLNLQTCHHFAPSRWCYRCYLHSPGELDLTHNASALRNEGREYVEVWQVLENERHSSEESPPLKVLCLKIEC